MRKYLLREDGNSYKANLHVHTNISDGGITPEEAKEGYKSHGYSVLAYTDHEVFVPHNDMTDEDFLAINATELAINDNWPGGFKYNKSFHLNLYAKTNDKTECCVCTGKSIFLEHSKAYVSETTINNKYRKFHSREGINDLIQRANNDGFLVCYNHPVWSLHNYSDYIDLSGLWGVEVYNTSSARGGYEDTTQPLDDLVNRGQRVVAVAADDAHNLNASAYGGWTMIKADKLDYDSIISALERGDCYSSNGPEIKEISIEDGVVNIKASDVVFVKLVTDIRFARSKNGSENTPLTDVSFDINDFIVDAGNPDQCRRSAPWFRLEVRDKSGKKAWTRPYFLDELE
ncbi:MAG: hypothetical protein IJY23_00040 [Clostridia bacterium]|nr:hypothetical protein [Clostridia bacterium]